MADISWESAVGYQNRVLHWTGHFDDAANTVRIDVDFKDFDGGAVPDPQSATVTVQLNSSVDVTIDCLTGKFTAPANLRGQDFSQASPGPLLNAGAKTRSGVRLKVSANRAATLTFDQSFTI